MKFPGSFFAFSSPKTILKRKKKPEVFQNPYPFPSTILQFGGLKIDKKNNIIFNTIIYKNKENLN